MPVEPSVEELRRLRVGEGLTVAQIAQRVGLPTTQVKYRLYTAGIYGVRRPGITDLEVGYSARSTREWDQLMDALAAFELIETTADHVRRARQVQRMLAAKHQRGRKIPDLLAAAAAEARGLTVLHYDADFDRIAAVTGQRCEWVVAAGSVD